MDKGLNIFELRLLIDNLKNESEKDPSVKELNKPIIAHYEKAYNDLRLKVEKKINEILNNA